MYHQEKLAQTVKIPASALEFMSSRIPQQMESEFMKQGIDAEKIIKAVRKDNFRGTLMIIEDEYSNQKSVISIE
jgi:hypothetical protein